VRRPSSGGSAGCQNFRTLSGAVCQQGATSFARRHERSSQRFVRTHNMIIRPPPFQVSEQARSGLRCGPGATCQRCHPMTDREWSPLAESGVQPSREASPLQGVLKSCLCPKAHQLRHAHQLASPAALFHLARDQAHRHLPREDFAPSAASLAPGSNMGSSSRERHMEPLTGEERKAERRPRSVAESG
jgi:hypothetical protein